MSLANGLPAAATLSVSPLVAALLIFSLAAPRLLLQLFEGLVIELVYRVDALRVLQTSVCTPAPGLSPVRLAKLWRAPPQRDEDRVLLDAPLEESTFSNNVQSSPSCRLPKNQSEFC